MTLLILFLFAFGIHFRYLCIPETGINIYLPILGLGILRSLISTRKLISKLFISPAGFLFILSILGLVQNSLGEHTSNLPTVAVFSVGFLIAAFVPIFLEKSTIRIESILNLLTFLSFISSLFLLAQTLISIRFDIYPWLTEFDLVKDYLGDISGIVEARGRGLGRSVLDYSTHNFIPLFYLFYLSGSHRRSRGLAIVALSVLGLALVISKSGSVFISIGVATAVYSIEKWSKWRPISAVKVVAIVASIAGIIFLVIPYLANSVTRGEIEVGSSLMSRVFVWSISISMFLDHPIVGLGLGNFSTNMEYYQPFHFIDYSHVAISAHSWFFDLLATGGLIGCGAFSLFLLGAYRQARFCCVYGAVTDIDRILFLSLVAYIPMGLFGTVHIFSSDYYFLAALICFRYRQRSEELVRQMTAIRFASEPAPATEHPR